MTSKQQLHIIKLLFIFSLLLLVNLAAAQPYIITGKVLDKITHEPIPFVNVVLQGKNIGTISDFNGIYTLNSSQLSDSLTASSIGYQSLSRALSKNGEQKINFYLERASINLEAIIIRPSENPAHILLKKIIANKKKNRSDLVDYSAEKYNKTEMDLYDWKPGIKDRKVMKPFLFIFDRIDSISDDIPFLPVYLTEETGNYYYKQSSNTEIETPIAKIASGFETESVGDFLQPLLARVDIYDNWAELMGKNFVSPIANSGLNYYKYYLVDSNMIDGHWCYKINFIPKGKGSFTYLGDMWVADSSFAIKDIRMEVAKHVNINWIDRISLHQEFESINDSFWMRKKDKVVIRFKIMENKAGIIGRRTLTFKDIQINGQVPERQIATKEKETKFFRDEEYWDEHRPEALTENEKGIYEMIDSLNNTKAFKTWIDIFDMIITGYYSVKYFELGPITSVYSVNDVDRHRFRLGFRTTSDLHDRFRLGAYGAIGIGDTRFKYGIDVLGLITKSPRQSISASYIYDLDLRKNNPAQFGQDNVLTGVLRRNVPQKLNFIQEGSVTYFKEWKSGYSNSVKLKHSKIVPQDNFNFKYLKRDTDNSADTTETIRTSEMTLKFRYAHREKFMSDNFDRISLGSKYPVISVFYTLGLKGVINSEYDYHKIDLVVTDEFPINPIGTFMYAIIVGKVFGDLPYLLLGVHQGNETFFYNEFAFNLMNQYEFVSDMYASIRVIHHFNGFFFDKIPVIRKLNWRTVIGAKAVMGSMTEKNRKNNQLNNFIVPSVRPYAEASVGIENIFKLFEVHVLWRLTYRNAPNENPYTGPNFGVRMGLKLDF